MRSRLGRVVALVSVLLFFAGVLVHYGSPPAEAQSNACLKAHYYGEAPVYDCVCFHEPANCYAPFRQCLD